MIKEGDIVIYSVKNRPFLGIVGSQNAQTGKFRILPIRQNYIVQKSEYDIMTLDDFHKRLELLETRKDEPRRLYE